MKNTTQTKDSKQFKFKTTLYLAEDNKEYLQDLPLGEKTKVVNEAIRAIATQARKKQAFSKVNKILEGLGRNRIDGKKSSEDTIGDIRNGSLQKFNTNS